MTSDGASQSLDELYTASAAGDVTKVLRAFARLANTDLEIVGLEAVAGALPAALGAASAVGGEIARGMFEPPGSWRDLETRWLRSLHELSDMAAAFGANQGATEYALAVEAIDELRAQGRLAAPAWAREREKLKARGRPPAQLVWPRKS